MFTHCDAKDSDTQRLEHIRKLHTCPLLYVSRVSAREAHNPVEAVVADAGVVDTIASAKILRIRVLCVCVGMGIE